jgi:hypothetical protein
MRRTSVVLAVVSVMVTVLVFAAPAFAIPSPNAHPSGPGGIDPVTKEDSPEPDNIGGESDVYSQPDGCIGGIASGQALSTTQHGGPPGHHVMHVTGEPIGQTIQDAQDFVC